jgi:hypothetical protein
VVEIIGRICKVRSKKCELGQGPWNVHSVKCLSTLRKSNFAKWSGKCKMWYLFGIVHAAYKVLAIKSCGGLFVQNIRSTDEFTALC